MMNSSSNIRDILSSFSPAQDFLAVSSVDGRIKIWDTVKGQLQTEFSELALSETENFFGKERGHLSMDYKCMKWLSLDRKKKRKLGSSLLILGTGSGDVLAVDVAAGQLKWSATDCHPGGVTAISFPNSCSSIYAAGADGMVSELDSNSGSLLQKFRASTKAISSMAVSSDGKMIATAAGQLKIFNNSDKRKLQKFSGHPGNTRCIIYSDDGKYVLSSAVGERYIAVWKIDGSKTKTACCTLAMDHPAIFLDCKLTNPQNTEKSGLCVLAISELGICYFWHGKNIEELRNSKPTKICVSLHDDVPKKYKESLPNIFAAKLQTFVGPASGHVYLAHGLTVKPSFEKIVVQPGTDVRLHSSLNGMLLPISQSLKSKKKSNLQNSVTALDRANAEDALLPVPKVLDFLEKKTGVQLMVSEDDADDVNADAATFCMEDKLRSLGLLTHSAEFTSSPDLDSSMLKDINLETCVPQKKMKASILSMTPGEAFNFLKVLLSAWQSRTYSGRYVLPWVCCILVNHHDYIVAQEQKTHLLDALYKLTKSKGDSIHSLLQLSGRLQLVMVQIDKATNNKYQKLEDDEMLDESEDEEEDDVEEVMYGVEEDSETSEED